MKKREQQPLSDSDKKLFRDTVKQGKLADKDNLATHPKVIDDNQSEPPHYALSDQIDDPLSPEQTVFYCRSSLPKSTVQKLQRGQLSISNQLDLHGHTIEQAREALSHFIHINGQQGNRYLLIIHGKSTRSAEQKPILKNLVNRWLRQLPQVLAFCSAQNKHGGSGAVYVLLKK